MIVVCWTLIVLSAAWVTFAYAGYPLALMLMARLSPRPVSRADISPPLSLIVAVYNGEKVLRQTREATLALEYAGALEIIVASDGSTDGTDTIAESFAERGVRLWPWTPGLARKPLKRRPSPRRRARSSSSQTSPQNSSPKRSSPSCAP